MAGAIGYATVQLIPSFEGLEKTASGELDAAMTPAARESGRKTGGIFGNGFMTTIGHVMVAAGLYQIGQSIAHGIGAGIATGLKTASFMQQAQISFATLLGNGGEAEKMLTNLSKFAARTPFELQGVTTATQQLLGAGSTAKDVIPTLTALGDTEAAMGGSQDQLSHTMLAWTQIMTRGKLDTQDLLQISNSGIPIWKELAKAVGKPVSSIQDLVASGKLAADTTLPKLQAQLEKDYGGSMAKQAKTLAGVWSTVKDTVTQALGKAFMPLAPMLARTLPGAANAAANGILGIGNAIKATYHFFGDVKTVIGNTFGPAISSAVRGAGQALKPLGALFKGAFSSLGPDISQIIPALSPVSSIFKSMLPVIPVIAQLFSNLAQAILPALIPVFGSLAGVARLVAQFWGEIGTVFAGALITAIQQLAPMLGQVVRAFGQLLQPISQLATNLLPAFALLASGPLVSAFQMIVNQGLKLVISLFKTLIPVAVQIIHALMPLAQMLVAVVLPAFMGLVRSALPPLMTLFRALMPVIVRVAALFGHIVVILAQTLVPVIKALIPVVSTVIRAIIGVIKPIVTVISGVIKVISGVLTGNWKEAWSGIKDIFKGVWNLIISIFKGAWNILKSLFKAAGPIIGALWKAAWNILKTVVKAAWNAAKGLVKLGITGVVNLVKGIGSLIKGALRGAGTWLVSAGRNIVTGLINGIKSLAGTIGHFFLSLLPGWIRGPFEAALGIHSPSKVFFAYGVNIADGAILGVTRRMAAVKQVSKKLADALMKPVSDAIGKIGQESSSSPAFDITTLGIRRVNAQIKAAATALAHAMSRGLSAVDARPLADKITAAARLAQKELKNLRVKINTTDLKNITKSLTGSVDDMHTAFTQIIADMKAAGAAPQIVKAMAVQESALTRAMTAQAAVTSKLSAAQDTLNSLMDSYNQQVDSVTSSIQSYADIATMGALGSNLPVSLDRMISQFTEASQSAQQFTSSIATLKSRGLSGTLISQLIAAGPGQAAQQVQALLGATPAQIAQLNQVASQVMATGNQLGTLSAQVMYSQGIASAQALVAGLKSQQDGLTKTIATLSKGTQVLTEKGMKEQGAKAADGLIAGLQSKQGKLIAAITAIGASMIAAFKKQFKIHSPSRLMADEVGAPIVQGIAMGMLASADTLRSAANRVSPFALAPLPTQPALARAGAVPGASDANALIREVRALKAALVTALGENAHAIGQSVHGAEQDREMFARRQLGGVAL